MIVQYTKNTKGLIDHATLSSLYSDIHSLTEAKPLHESTASSRIC